MSEQSSTNANPIPQSAIAAVALAGGRASRFGFEDKALKTLNDKPLVNYVVEKLSRYSAHTLISVNRNLSAYESLGLPLIRDVPGTSNGPLAGIFSAMCWCQTHAPGVRYLVCAPADAPYFPAETFQRLLLAADGPGSPIAWIKHNDQAQPLFSVWPVSLITQIEQTLSSGVYGVKILIQTLPNICVEMPRENELEFCNVNSQTDLESLQSRLFQINPK